MASEDNEFVVQIMNALDRRVERMGRESLSGPIRVVYLLWWTREYVGDGGIARFHLGNLNVSDAVHAFEQLDFPDAVKALRDSLSFFPPDVSAGENAERAGWLISVYHDESEEDWEVVYERVADFFQPYTDVILELDPDGLFGTRLANYIRMHSEAFNEVACDVADSTVYKTSRPLNRWPNRRAAMSKARFISRYYRERRIQTAQQCAAPDASSLRVASAYSFGGAGLLSQVSYGVGPQGERLDMHRRSMKQAIAILLVVADFILLALGSRIIWSLRDQGYTAKSHGIIAFQHFVGFFPFGVALFLFVAVLLAAGLVYPWPSSVSETEASDHSQSEIGVWPPPPISSDPVPVRKPVHHWSRPDRD